MTADSPASTRLPRPGTYRIDPERSTVSYAGRHMFGLGAVHATFTISSGLLQVADPVTASTAEMTVDASSFRSDKPRRDKDVRSARFLDAVNYPEIGFVSEDLRQDGDGWLLSGTVTAHGNQVPVQIRIDRVALDGDRLDVHARAEHLDRYAFGITKAKGMAGRYLDLDLDVVADPA